MLRSLIQSNPYSYILIILISGGSWFMPTFLTSIDYISFGYEIPKYLGLVISFLITLIGAHLVNIQLRKGFFVNENSIAFILFFMLISSLSTSFEGLVDISLMNLAFCVFVSTIFHMKEEQNRVLNIFNSSFFIGILSLVNVFFIPYLYLVVSGIGSIRRFMLKDLWMILAGILIPTGILYAFSYLLDNFEFLSTRISFNFSVRFIPYAFYVPALLIIGLAILGAFAIKSNRSIFGVKILRTFNTVMYLFIISCLVGIINLFVNSYEVYFACVALGSSILIASIFVFGEFKGKDTLLATIIILLLGAKFLL